MTTEMELVVDAGGDQRLATEGFSTPQGVIASPLHRLVQHSPTVAAVAEAIAHRG